MSQSNTFCLNFFVSPCKTSFCLVFLKIKYLLTSTIIYCKCNSLSVDISNYIL